MSETDTEDTGYTGPTSDRCGIITAVMILLPEVTIEACDTQGSLRKKGVFKKLHERLLLPESYVIHGIFTQRYYGRAWDILVESPDLPETNEPGQEYPRIEPIYGLIDDNGTITPYLVELKIHEVKHVPVTGGVNWMLQAL